jgi:hypothetical protein
MKMRVCKSCLSTTEKDKHPAQQHQTTTLSKTVRTRIVTSSYSRNVYFCRSGVCLLLAGKNPHRYLIQESTVKFQDFRSISADRSVDTFGAVDTNYHMRVICPPHQPSWKLWDGLKAQAKWQKTPRQIYTSVDHFHEKAQHGFFPLQPTPHPLYPVCNGELLHW